MNNQSQLIKIKGDLSRASNDRFISQEAMIKLIADKAGVDGGSVACVMAALQALIVERFASGEDVLLPGIMRIVPGYGGLTRRYIKIRSISEKLKERLR
jgi:hypothetical protein